MTRHSSGYYKHRVGNVINTGNLLAEDFNLTNTLVMS
jgi:hypothetical protein